MSSELKDIAIRIKKCMDEKGLKQVDLVKTTGISKGSASKWLAGKARPNGEYLLKLSQVLDKPEYWIINGEYPYGYHDDADNSIIDSLEEKSRDYYIEKLGLDPNLPYSIKYLQEQYEEKIFVEFEEEFELSTEQKDEIKEFEEHLDFEATIDDLYKNQRNLEAIKESITIDKFVDNFGYSDELLKKPYELAERANANIEKTLFYHQNDHSMEPIISINAQCFVDLTKRTLRNGKTYLIKRSDFYGIRVLFRQSDGSLLLECKNQDFPSETVPKSKAGSIVIVGYVYAWTNISPW